MSRLREVESRLTALGEMREIMAAMKNLAFMETHKLTRFMDYQRLAVATIERAATDFLSGWPEYFSQSVPTRIAFVVIGSERGFCGNYNEKLLEAVESHCRRMRCRARLVTVGSRLENQLRGDSRLLHSMAGATVAEEVPEVLQEVVTVINRLDKEGQPATWFGLHHSDSNNDGSFSSRLTSLLPPFQQLKTRIEPLAGQPHLYLEPEGVLKGLVDHYLFALLNTIFFEALLTEHQRRVQHLSGAIDRLDESCRNLNIRRNVLRQEEITEEIEMIMLSAGALEEEG